MAGDLEQPLLHFPDGGQRGKLYAQEFRGAPDTSLRKLGCVDDGEEVTVTGVEVRAASYSCTPDLDFHSLQAIAQGQCEMDSRLENQEHNLLDEVLRRLQALNEEEIRELLFDHVGLNCCITYKPAANWRVQRVEDCSAYVATLETFIEERAVKDEVEPYMENCVDSQDKGRMPNAWEMDMKAEIPLLFISGKQAQRKVPNSETIRICGDCIGRGKLPYNPSQPAFFMKCGRCSSGTSSCESSEGSQNWVRCGHCNGHGALLYRKVLNVTWRTILLKRVCITKKAKSVPDEVFRKVKGVRLYQSQSYQCEPACFSALDSLSRFSESVISERASIPESARIICERHRISIIPVIRVVMVNKRKSFKFYILGLSREIFVEEYPSGLFSLCGICSIC